MQIYVNNQLAALKKGTSFEYVSENRMFSGSDGYTLTITFPLRGCPENLAIFGHINRADVAAQKVIFDCEIRDGSFYKFGSITITEISEVEVKTQFLEGRSEQNFDKTFDKVYINELDLGAPPTTAKSAITPSNAWFPDNTGCQCVALPWVNDYSGNIQNKAENIVDDAVQNKSHFEWSEDTTGLSWQPYLLYITKKICEAVGYSADFSKWEEVEEYKYLLICNTLPYAWYMPGFANALPHWTVEEYFEKLELFLGGESSTSTIGASVLRLPSLRRLWPLKDLSALNVWSRNTPPRLRWTMTAASIWRRRTLSTKIATTKCGNSTPAIGLLRAGRIE